METTTIYILRLTNDKFYIGKTTNPQKRLQEHYDGFGCEWTKIYKPVATIAIIPNCSIFDEDRYTLEYMNKFGIGNVRGGTFSMIILRNEDLQIIQRLIWSAKDLCAKCGASDHFIKDCPALKRKSVSQPILQPVEKTKHDEVHTADAQNNSLTKECPIITEHVQPMEIEKTEYINLCDNQYTIGFDACGELFQIPKIDNNIDKIPSIKDLIRSPCSYTKNGMQVWRVPFAKDVFGKIVEYMMFGNVILHKIRYSGDVLDMMSKLGMNMLASDIDMRKMIITERQPTKNAPYVHCVSTRGTDKREIVNWRDDNGEMVLQMRTTPKNTEHEFGKEMMSISDVPQYCADHFGTKFRLYKMNEKQYTCFICI